MSGGQRDAATAGSGRLARAIADLILALWIVGVVGAYYRTHGHIDLLQRLLGLSE